MRLLTRFFLLCSIAIITVGPKVYAEIPDYVGKISFSLNDDENLNKLIKNTEDAKKEFEQSQHDDAKDTIQALDNNIVEYKNKLTQEILKINKEGARAGKSDGAMDGSDASINSAEGQVEIFGPNYKPTINHSKSIMIKAFADGYNYSYKLYSRLEFQRRVNSTSN